MGSNYTSYPTLYAISTTVYDSGGVGDGYVTQTQNFFGTTSTGYTGTNYYRTYRGHLRGLEPFYVSGTTQTANGSVHGPRCRLEGTGDDYSPLRR